MPKLEIFIRHTCPYCQKVLKFLKDNKITIPIKDIVVEPKSLEKLIKIGGKQQVPCLFIDGYPMYESDDIIFWLKNNKVEE